MLVGNHQLFDGAVHEIADHAVNRAAIPFDHDASLPCGNKLRVVPPSCKFPGHLDGGHHFAHRTVVANGVNPEAVCPQVGPVRNIPLVVLADVLDRGTPLLGPPHQVGIIR